MRSFSTPLSWQFITTKKATTFNPKVHLTIAERNERKIPNKSFQLFCSKKKKFFSPRRNLIAIYTSAEIRYRNINITLRALSWISSLHRNTTAAATYSINPSIHSIHHRHLRPCLGCHKLPYFSSQIELDWIWLTDLYHYSRLLDCFCCAAQQLGL